MFDTRHPGERDLGHRERLGRPSLLTSFMINSNHCQASAGSLRARTRPSVDREGFIVCIVSTFLGIFMIVEKSASAGLKRVQNQGRCIMA